MTPALNSESRLMLIAPHPDDEALACSIILQRTVRAGAAIRIVYATDGDDNPWPQRVLERKWRLSAADRKRWGRMRRVEALAALRVLGVAPANAHFLGLPDQGLTDLLKNDCRSALERFAEVIAEWSPTHLLVPSVADTHPDHSALAVMLRLVLAELSDAGIAVWSYVIHGKSAAFSRRAQQLRQSKTEMAAKLLAIRCHKTQIKLSRRRFLAYAERPERLLKLGFPEATTTVDGSIRSVRRQAHVLRLELRLSVKLIGTAEPALFVLGQDSAGELRCLRVPLPVRSGNIDMLNCLSDRPHIVARYRGNTFAGDLAIPIDFFSPGHALFVKLERRSLFFDEAGWLEIPAIVRARQSVSLTAAEPLLAIR